MTKSNSADAFKIHFTMMQMSGVWPKKNPGIFYNIKAATSWTVAICLCLTMLIEVINDLNDFTKLSEIFYIMVSITIYLVKLGGFTYARKTFMNILEFLKDPIFVSYPNHLDHYMAKTIKISTIISNLYRYLCLCCMIMFAVFPVLDKKPFPFPFPYDVGRYNYLVYVFQLSSMCSSAWNNSCLDTLTTSLVGLGAAQLDIIRERLIDIGNEEKISGQINKRRTIKNLKQCVQHHLAIIKFIESIDSVFSIGLLAQFLASILVICNTLFHFVLVSANSSQFFMLATYFITMLSQLSMYCWYGNEIMWKSVRVGEACYLSKWYNHDKEFGQYLSIIMERSKRPLVVTAWKFSKLSVNALSSILQWSYSYLALLLKMYNEKSPTY